MTSETSDTLRDASLRTLWNPHWITLFKTGLNREYLDRAVRNVMSDPVNAAVIRYCLARRHDSLPLHWLCVIREEYALVCAEAVLDEGWS